MENSSIEVTLRFDHGLSDDDLDALIDLVEKHHATIGGGGDEVVLDSNDAYIAMNIIIAWNASSTTNGIVSAAIPEVDDAIGETLH